MFSAADFVEGGAGPDERLDEAASAGDRTGRDQIAVGTIAQVHVEIVLAAKRKACDPSRDEIGDGDLAATGAAADLHHCETAIAAICLGLGTVFMRASLGAGASIPLYLAIVGSVVVLLG